MDRFSEYRIMWVLVFFDLPTDTKKDRKAHALFRKNLLHIPGHTRSLSGSILRHKISLKSAILYPFIP